VAAYLLDTNLLVYPHDPRDPGKQRRAGEVLTHLAGTGNARLPAQALAEFANVCLRKFGHPAEAVYAQVEVLERTFTVLPLTEAVVLEAVRGVGSHGLSYYDAQVWAVAKLNQIAVVVSEDFQDGATLEGVTFVNPFGEDWLAGRT
jgi:predicted nucleic acid-binding protein